MNNTDGSFSGINDADGITACPWLLKKFKYLFLISIALIYIFTLSLKNLLHYTLKLANLQGFYLPRYV